MNKQSSKEISFCQNMIDYVSQYPRDTHYTYTCQINGEYVDAVVSISNERDFIASYTDSIVLRVRTTFDKYINYIYPNRRNLTITLLAKEVHENEKLELPNGRQLKRIYRGLLVSIEDNNAGSGVGTVKQTNEVPMASQRLFDFDIQLIDYAAEKLRQVEIGGKFNDVIPGDVLKAFLTNVANDTTIPNRGKIKGVEHVKWDNQTKRSQLLIPHNTNVLKLPELIQTKEGGIYNNGIGLFLYEDWWWVYPISEFNRYDKEKYKATIVIVPKGMVGETKRTFVTNNGELIIIATGEVHNLDTWNNREYNSGNGRVVVDTDKLLTDSISTKGNKLMFDGTKAISTIYTKKREDGVSYAPTEIGSSTNSMASNVSQIREQQGTTVAAVWEWSSHDLIRPAMPCKLIYFKEDVMYHHKGTIVKVKTQSELQTTMTQDRRYKNTTGLVLYVER